MYIEKGRLNCGPAAFINLVGIKGNKKIEDRLARAGKLHPFKISDYTSFLVWAKKYNFPIEVYTSSKKLNNKIFKYMFFKEEIPKKLQPMYKKEGLKLFKKRNKQLGKKIHFLKDPIKKIDELLSKRYRIAIGTSNAYLKNSKSKSLHWIVAFNKFKSKYYFMDPGKGITLSTKRLLKKSFSISKLKGFNPQIIAYKK